jgi:stearoyl-CoA desaturase (delta-9 desaturase)
MYSNLSYLVHFLIAVVMGHLLNSYLVSFAYFSRIMGHPVQGRAVNALAHKYGCRNFELEDNSRNNLWVGLLVFGEGLQNNHHAFPRAAKFSHRFPEIDLGYLLCLVGEKLGLIRIARESVRK